MSELDEKAAWHFVGDKLRDGRPIPADGEWLIHEGEAMICESGLHASIRIIDALQYAPGSTICRVTCRDVVDTQDDKLVCRERRIDWRVTDADDLLRAFARKAALSVIHLWNAPDIVRRYLETGDESIRATASVAASVVASIAAKAAAWAASVAARDASIAASVVARDTVSIAARASARAAAWATACAASDAASVIARDAASVIARDALSDFNATLEPMVVGYRRGKEKP